MVEHDGQVGQLLKKLDELGIANNTIVIYTTDNGAEAFSWPDGGTTPFRGEKNTNWEGGYRVPAMVRWPGLVPPRTEINDIFSAEDWATDPGRSGWRAGHQEQAAAGLRRRRQELQGSSRRLRPARSSRRQGPEQAPRILLLDRRRQPCRPSLRAVEGGVHGTEGARLRCLGGAVGAAASAQAVQSALGSIRTGPARGGRLYPMVRRARVRAGSGADRSWRSISQSFQQFPPRQKPGSFSVEQAMEKLRQLGLAPATRPTGN